MAVDSKVVDPFQYVNQSVLNMIVQLNYVCSLLELFLQWTPVVDGKAVRL